MPGSTHRHLKLASATAVAVEEGPPSFEAIYRRWAPYVGRIVTRILGPGADVDDVVQNIFVDVHRNFDQLRDPERVRPWLATIAVRRARRHLSRRRLRRFIGLDAVGEIRDSRISPERRADYEAAYRVLDGVKPAERIAWVLRHVEGETLLDVAKICGCSRATAHRRITAVARAFAKEFEHDA